MSSINPVVLLPVIGILFTALVSLIIALIKIGPLAACLRQIKNELVEVKAEISSLRHDYVTRQHFTTTLDPMVKQLDKLTNGALGQLRNRCSKLEAHIAAIQARFEELKR